MNDFDSAFDAVAALVKQFAANESYYLSPTYKEAEARVDFIDKFFTALGWDVAHQRQNNPYEQEVKIERKEHGVSQRKADYAFYLAPDFKNVKFFVEAKKPYGDIATRENYFQAARYGWGGHTPVAVLFDFEQFEIIDSRYKPSLQTALSHGIKKYHYHQYADRDQFAEIYWLFSREAVAGGSLEKFAETLPKGKRLSTQRGLLKGGYKSMDEEFLEDLDKLREQLARMFKNRNPQLDGETLTEITQRTIDRLVFIRFLEDKGIEPDYLIANFGRKGTAWGDFIAQTRRLDNIYNGIVFKPHEVLDSTVLRIDETVFAEICEQYSHTQTPYDFNAIPIHILGSIYERFLGTIITVSDKRAKLEQKPEVRKAGGVYYTPEYIVNYIVEHTIGKLLDGKTPEQISKLRFADIACGSGSFLLGAYDYVIRHVTKYYNNGSEEQRAKWRKQGLIRKSESGWLLTLTVKRQILLNNIYGVDIDQQAVEVAQLSLYLKLLQDEGIESTHDYQTEFHETLLPSLNDNITCGNSLVSRDIFDGELFETDAEKKLNPMNFEDRFPHILKRVTAAGKLQEAAWHASLHPDLTPMYPWQVSVSGSYKKKRSKKEEREIDARLSAAATMFEGGFDAIIGNPPYVMIENGMAKNYLRKHYETDEGKPDLYKYFIERAHKLLASKGYFGMIIPASLLMTPAYARCREFLLKNAAPISVVCFDGQVFTAQVNSIILITQNVPADGNVLWLEDKTPHPSAQTLPLARLKNIPVAMWQSADQFKFTRPQSTKTAWISKVRQKSVSLGSLGHYSLGMQIYHNTMHSSEEMKRRIYHSSLKEVGKNWYPESGGCNIQRYQFLPKYKEYVKYGDHCYHKPAPEFLSGQRLVIREIIGTKLNCAYTEEKHIPNKAVIIFRSDTLNLKFILAILNSTLMGKYVTSTTEKGKQRLFPRISLKSFRELPIPKLNLDTSADNFHYHKLITLVSQMQTAKQQLTAAVTDKDKNFYTHKCHDLDRAIDRVVYELYDLTDAEIAIVEEHHL